ncbi:hypothetical protein JOB18_046341 [Xyrichtys novacula]|uniref:Uncharacterized protein n=1 Tax=Xyrichtys novacula TaxID=13765 RepID=A0AAV1F0X6_XYRNO|nr:hypothetical protein JOB18_046341 [Xyrichtys novacula]
MVVVKGGEVVVVVEWGGGGGGPYCCISMGAVQIPRDYWREKRGEEKNDARFPRIRDDWMLRTSPHDDHDALLSFVGLFAVWACCSKGSSQEALTPKSICTGSWHQD